MKKNDISRRDFLRRIGIGASLAGLSMAGCSRQAEKLSGATVALCI